MQMRNDYSFGWLVLLAAFLAGCSKSGNPGDDTGNAGAGTGNNKDTACLISTISQVNSGTGTESSLSVFYNTAYGITKIVVYDSLSKTRNFEANLDYIRPDSIRIDPYQYLLLDAGKRVIRLVTKSDLADPVHADTYVFKYSYNSDGYLETKDLFINGSVHANFSTNYLYNNGQLTDCRMTTPSAGDGTMLESTLTYDSRTTIKKWIYTFPDAMEGYPYSTVLNFGKHVVNPLSKIVTKIYNPVSGILLDTWTTNYGNYKIDAKGYVISGVATGDLQQGMASFYGKTNFYYSCH